MFRVQLPHPPVRAAVLGAGVLLTAGTLAACSSSGDGASSSSASAPTPPPTTATVTTSVPNTASGPRSDGGSSSARAGGGGGASGPTQCAESQLRATLDPRPQLGTLQRGKAQAVIVDFQNTSSTTCTLYGYPGAAIVDNSGQQVKQAQRTIRGQYLGLPRSQNSLPTATLKPGAYASAGIEGVNQKEVGAAQAGCDASPYPQILVTPPNTRTAVPFKYTWPVCYSFTVHPVNIENDPPSS